MRRPFPPTTPSPQTESLWRRAVRDTERVRHSLAGKVAGFVIGLAAAVVLDEVLASASRPSVRIAVFVILAAVLVFAALGAVLVFQLVAGVFRQRRDWSRQIVADAAQAREAWDRKFAECEDLRGQLAEAEAKLRRLEQDPLGRLALSDPATREPVFPASRIAVKNFLAMDLHELDPDERAGSMLLLFQLDVTNRQTDRDMHLVFTLRNENAQHGVGMTIHPYHGLTSKGQSLGVLDSPLEVPATKHISGSLAFSDDFGRWVDYKDLSFAASENCQFVLHIEDYASGGKLPLDVPGTWEST